MRSESTAKPRPNSKPRFSTQFACRSFLSAYWEPFPDFCPSRLKRLARENSSATPEINHDEIDLTNTLTCRSLGSAGFIRRRSGRSRPHAWPGRAAYRGGGHVRRGNGGQVHLKPSRPDDPGYDQAWTEGRRNGRSRLRCAFSGLQERRPPNSRS